MQFPKSQLFFNLSTKIQIQIFETNLNLFTILRAKIQIHKKIKDAFFHFLSQDESLKMAHKRMENSQSLMHIFRQQLGKLR